MSTTNMFQPVTPPSSSAPTIKVIGVGGGGGNAVSHMIRQGLHGVEFIAVNTDIKALNQCAAAYRIQLGDRGTGAGTKPEVGRELALQSRDALADAIRGADLLFIAAGMGGGTGTGVAPIIAEIANDLNIMTVAVVTKPFTSEGPAKMRVANEAVDVLEKLVNSLIVVQNDKLKKELPPNVKMSDALAAADNVLYNAVSGVSDIITQEGYMQLDFADVCAVMEQGGVTMMGSATAEGENRATDAADSALRSPLLEGVEMKDALGVLVYIAASRESLGLDEFEMVMGKIRECASDEAIIKAGLVYDESLGEKIKVTALITGLGRPKQSGIRPTPRHSHGLPREDARGNPIAPSMKQDAPPSLPSSSYASSTSFQPSITPVFGQQDTQRMGSPHIPPMSQTLKTRENLPPLDDQSQVPGVFRKNQTRSQQQSNDLTRHDLSGLDTGKPLDRTQVSPFNNLLKNEGVLGTVTGADAASSTNHDLSKSFIPRNLRKIG